MYEKRVGTEWVELLEGDPSEDRVQKFLELNPAMIPGGRGDIGPGGHHGAEWGGVFREVPLKGIGRDRRPDFMWVTRSSSLITPICIEIEKPNRPWFTATGKPTSHLTASLDQLTDWKLWFREPENRSAFTRTYVTRPFRERTLEPQYVLIYGRQAEFEKGYTTHKDPERLRHKRDFMRRPNEYFMTFDSLRPNFDLADTTSISMKAEGPELFAFSPTATLGPYTSDIAHLLRDPRTALERSASIPQARRAYLAERWDFWKLKGDEQAAGRVHRRQGFRGE